MALYRSLLSVDILTVAPMSPLAIMHFRGLAPPNAKKSLFSFSTFKTASTNHPQPLLNVSQPVFVLNAGKIRPDIFNSAAPRHSG